MNYQERNPDDTYVLDYMEDRFDGYARLTVYDSNRSKQVGVRMKKEELPAWLISGYHQMIVAGDGFEITLDGGNAIKHNERYWFLCSSFAPP
jgi:hypothetical protein